VEELAALGTGMGQLTELGPANLGFGFLYYGLVRICQPEIVVCIGSFRGFAPVCLALGLVDNQRGSCFFIDPGAVDDYWHDPQTTERLTRRFGLHSRWQHLRQTSQEAIASECLQAPIDLLLIDGDHSYAGVKFDFDQFGNRVRAGGLILLHDSISVGQGFTSWEVKQFLEAEVYGQPGYETLTLPFSAGLTLVRKLP
jgi:predicted O-methyltransferase YrrM